MSYDDFDGAVEEPVQAELGDTESMLEEVIHMIASAPNVPLSSTPRIDRDHVVGLLQDALAILPEEIRQARWMLKERTEFVQKTQREADEIVEAARAQAERMVQRALKWFVQQKHVRVKYLKPAKQMHAALRTNLKTSWTSALQALKFCLTALRAK